MRRSDLHSLDTTYLEGLSGQTHYPNMGIVLIYSFHSPLVPTATQRNSFKQNEAVGTSGIWRRPPPAEGPLMFWNERLATTRNSLMGEKSYGGLKYLPEATYAPVPGAATAAREKIPFLHGSPLRKLYPQDQWPFILIGISSALVTLQRTAGLYYIAQVAGENFVVMNPRDAEQLGIETGDVIRIETPTGFIEVPVAVEPTVIPGVLALVRETEGGRWADTAVVRPRYFELKERSLAKLVEELPTKVEVPQDAINPARKLTPLMKKLLFTKAPSILSSRDLGPDPLRFRGTHISPVGLIDPSLGWSTRSWISGGLARYNVPARVTKTGRKHSFSRPNLIW